MDSESDQSVVKGSCWSFAIEKMSGECLTITQTETAGLGEFLCSLFPGSNIVPWHLTIPSLSEAFFHLINIVHF